MSEPLRARLAVDDIGILIQSIAGRGYQIFGPTVRDGAIVYDEIQSIEDLPKGKTDLQAPGRYRLEPLTGKDPHGPAGSSESGALFQYAVGPQSWKKYLHPAEVKLFEANRSDGAFHILNGHSSQMAGPRAFVGVRACELAAIAFQDRVLLNGAFHDTIYQGRREGVLVVAVQCTKAADTCFCASLGTGPAIACESADIVLTEVVKGDRHWFLAEASSERGRDILGSLNGQPSTEEERNVARAAVDAAAKQTRSVDAAGMRDLLYRSFEHARWDKVADRCLNCANCTMVCPTCFCTTMEDASDVTGAHAERWRKWDSCFSINFSYIHGGSVRTSGKARYRQWMTHKLASWIDQFGSPGCVGCGRCIAWCPAGIDITEELRAIAEPKPQVLHADTHA